MKIMLVGVAVAALAIAACGKAGESGGGGGGGGGGANALSSLAKGTYKGPYGTIILKDDGSIDLAIKNCGYEHTSPGVVKVPPPDSPSCNDDKHVGKLVVKDHEIGVGGPDGTTYLYAAYVDKAGKLHVGVGGASVLVNTMGADKKGVIDSGMFVKINVGATCTITDEMKHDQPPAATPCHWEDKDGRTLFIWTQPDHFDKTKTEDVGMVYLKDEGLLVAPELIETAYTKS